MKKNMYVPWQVVPVQRLYSLNSLVLLYENLWEENFWWEPTDTTVFCRTWPLLNIAIFKMLPNRDSFLKVIIVSLMLKCKCSLSIFVIWTKNGHLSLPPLKVYDSHLPTIWLYLSKRRKINNVESSIWSEKYLYLKSQFSASKGDSFTVCFPFYLESWNFSHEC